MSPVRTLPKGAVAVPYNPDDVLGEFGWLWTDEHRGSPHQWHLVSTWLPDGIDAEPEILFHDAGDAHPLDVGAADDWAGSPYLPCTAPPCSPHAGVAITVRIAGGAQISFAHEEPGPAADELEAQALALIHHGLPQTEQETAE